MVTTPHLPSTLRKLKAIALRASTAWWCVRLLLQGTTAFGLRVYVFVRVRLGDACDSYCKGPRLWVARVRGCTGAAWWSVRLLFEPTALICACTCLYGCGLVKRATPVARDHGFNLRMNVCGLRLRATLLAWTHGFSLLMLCFDWRSLFPPFHKWK